MNSIKLDVGDSIWVVSPRNRFSLDGEAVQEGEVIATDSTFVYIRFGGRLWPIEHRLIDAGAYGMVEVQNRAHFSSLTKAVRFLIDDLREVRRHASAGLERVDRALNQYIGGDNE